MAAFGQEDGTYHLPHLSSPSISHAPSLFGSAQVSGLETYQLVSKSKSGSCQNITSAHIHLVKTSQKPRPKIQGGEIDLFLERAAHTRCKEWLVAISGGDLPHFFFEISM